MAERVTITVNPPQDPVMYGTAAARTLRALRGGKVTAVKAGKVTALRAGRAMAGSRGGRVTAVRVTLTAADVSKPERGLLTADRAALTDRPATARRVTDPRAAPERGGQRRLPLRRLTTKAR
jgi:hypothetical protein